MIMHKPRLNIHLNSYKKRVYLFTHFMPVIGALGIKINAKKTFYIIMNQNISQE